MKNPTACLEIADDTIGFAAGIVRLLRDPALRRERALKGLECVDTHFSRLAALKHLKDDVPEVGRLIRRKGALKRVHAG